MKMKTILPLAVLLIAATAHAETLPLNLELGYRWLNQSGNDAMYRTQINERSGFLIRSLSYATPDVRIDATDLGVGPSGSFRLESDRQGLYKFRLGYRSNNSFSALPTFANPLVSRGVFLSQHTYDRTRRMLDADLQFIPDRKISPFIGFSSNTNRGPGRTTYTLGQDEFVLDQNLHEVDREFRAGASFQFANVSGQLTQGWRKFRGSDSYSLPGASDGNNGGPILGTNLNAGTLVRSDITHVTTPFTNGYVTAQLGDRTTFVGNYVRFSADSSGDESESATGSFVSFGINRFFTGLTESASSRAKNTGWTGGARAEFNLWRDVDFLAGYQKDHRELTGSALIDTLFLQSVTFDHADLRDFRTILDAANSLTRNELTTTAGIVARSLGDFALRSEFRNTKQTVEASPDLAEIVVPGNQGGEFNRIIKTLDSTASWARAGWSLTANWRRDDANQPIFRTDYLDRNRVRLRAMWKAPRWVRAGVTGETTKQTNNQSDVRLNASVRQYSGEVEVTPISVLGLRGSYSKFRASSNVLYRVPQNFTTADSIREENGTSREGGVALTFPRWSLDTGLSRFRNSGSMPLSLERYRARFTFDVKAHAGVAAEWNRDKYSDLFALSDFRADRFGVYLRFTP